MAQNIEEFLRMAAAKKKQAQSASTSTSDSAANQIDNPQASFRARESSAAKLQQQAGQREVSPADLFIRDENDHSHASHPNLESRISPTVSTADIVAHASHLGEQLQGREKMVQSRVDRKFDHALGSLKKNELLPPEVVDHGRGMEDLPDLSLVVRQMLDPSSVRRAFILKEIFDRPKFDQP